MFLKILTFSGIFVISALSKKFPSEIQRCKYVDSECMIKRINELFVTKSHGYQDLLLPSLEPLKIESFSVVQGKNRPINLALNFQNASLFGLNKAKAYHVSGFSSDPQGNKLDIRVRAPLLVLNGPYKANGNFLIFPVRGSGMSNFTMENMDFKFKFLTKKIEENSKEYMQIDKWKADFQVSNFIMHLYNLFNGEKALEDNMDRFLSENWREILVEFKPSITKAFGKVFVDIINHVFSQFPYNEMFVD